MTKKEIRIRQAVADLIASIGCSCCGDREAQRKAEQDLGMLLAVPMYPDRSGFDFSEFRTKTL